MARRAIVLDMGGFRPPDDLPNDDPNGARWCLRAYRSAADLVPLAQVDTKSPIRALPMRPRIVEEDFPCREDVPVELDAGLEDEYHDHFENAGGLKLGGWPRLIQ